MVAKSFLGKQVWRQKLFIKKFCSKIISPISVSKEKLFEKNVFGENFYGFKIISSKTGLQEKNLEKRFCRNTLMVVKSFPRNRFEAKKKI